MSSVALYLPIIGPLQFISTFLQCTLSAELISVWTKPFGMIPLWKRIHRGRSDTVLTDREFGFSDTWATPCSVKNNLLFIWLTRQTETLKEYYLSGVCSTTRQTDNTRVYTRTHKQIKEVQAWKIEKENTVMQMLHEEDRADFHHATI